MVEVKGKEVSSTPQDGKIHSLDGPAIRAIRFDYENPCFHNVRAIRAKRRLKPAICNLDSSPPKRDSQERGSGQEH